MMLSMRIFISYSVKDTGLVEALANQLRKDAEVHYWSDSKEPGKEAWATIFGWIESADLVIAIISDETVKRGMSVGQEIGHAKANGKEILPMVAEAVPDGELGCLGGITYQKFSPTNPLPAISAIMRVIDRRRASENAIGWFILGALIVGFLWMVCGRKTVAPSLPTIHV
jgi:hypothetical protein